MNNLENKPENEAVLEMNDPGPIMRLLSVVPLDLEKLLREIEEEEKNS